MEKEIAIEAIQKIELNPKDILVVKIHPAHFSNAIRMDIHNFFTDILEQSGRNNEVIVVPDGEVKFEIIGEVNNVEQQIVKGEIVQ
jgi:hypothetical protein